MPKMPKIEKKKHRTFRRLASARFKVDVANSRSEFLELVTYGGEPKYGICCSFGQLGHIIKIHL